MSFVIYNKETTIIYRKRWYDKPYATLAAAKAGLTRAVKKGKINKDDYAIAETDIFHKHIEKKVTKRNLMSGKEFEGGVNDPACTDPSTETYWSM